jgi:hypothetical protein
MGEFIMVGGGIPCWLAEDGELVKDGMVLAGILALQELFNSTSIIKMSKVFFPICI